MNIAKTSARVCCVSGHRFGSSALMGLIDSNDFKSGTLRVSLLLSLDPIKRASTAGFHDFSDLAARYSFPHRKVQSIKQKGIAELIEAARPDYLLVIGWSELIPPSILNIPKAIKKSEARHAATHACIRNAPHITAPGARPSSNPLDHNQRASTNRRYSLPTRGRS